MSGTDDNGSPGAQEKPEAGPSEHLNIKVTDNNNEVFFKIKRTTALKKLMDAFCERQGKAPTSVRFLFDGSPLESTLTKLCLNPEPSKASSSFKKKQQPLADSWEDEVADDVSGEETDRPLSPQQSADYPSAPPPTPISSASRNDDFVSPYGYGMGMDGASDARTERNIRPEKTDAVAKRMIAGALGVRAPKKTDEQKAYDRAMKEKEIKRRNQEKEAAVRAREEAERAKAAVWND
ncbi:putative ubiquitin-like protein SMT3 [Amylocarpus encephaloides]|uniref:Ubiquitin-like protein SMT3 n=1 Tax=Amylocarpus encephaloides TaxID=45428 RepID=A0A9P7YHW8_9HELO|nr:putative ubiquitin-like protein SMT3 [Amylocarpus encephaloides]